MKRCEWGESACPMARAMGEIGDGWSILIVQHALMGMRRFGEFQEELGVARNILACRLRKLVKLGILETTPSATGGHREYHPTPKGRALFPVLIALQQWAEHHILDPDHPPYVMVDRHHHRPIPPLTVQSESGHPLTPADLLPVAPSEVAPPSE